MVTAELDGKGIDSLPLFIAALAAALADGERYFGWDLHSLGDCLQGGYVGNPPYDIEITDAEEMVEAFGHAGMSAYCDAMLRVIDCGGRGLIQEDAREWFVQAQRVAEHGDGPTLLDALFEVVRASPARIRLVGRDGRELASATGVPISCV